MDIFKKVRTIFHRDSDAITAAKKLPEAYRDMLGLTFMLCEDKEETDWIGMGSPVPLAEIQDADSESGEFTFFFVIQRADDNEMFDKFSAKMAVAQLESAFRFKSGVEHVDVTSPINSWEPLKPVLEMALRNKFMIAKSDPD